MTQTMATGSALQGPGLPQTQSGLSALFSLSDAAASVRPIATDTSPSATPVSSHAPLPAESNVEETSSVKTRSSSRAKEAGHKDLASGKNGAHSHALKHRRISSTSQARRRMSDAREAVSVAAARPSPASYSSSSALEALSSLSLSQSHGHQVSTSVSSSHNLHSHFPPVQRGRSHTASTTNDGAQLASSQPINIAIGSSQSKGHSSSASRSVGVGSTLVGSISSSIGEELEGEELDDFEEGDRASSLVPDGATGKKGRALKVRKRGTIFQCESCSKVYRHPSCLVKHRWEHSPHWREASKFMYSKHQQVQLLEAATILSHLDPVSSLPEDRSHWPSFVSHGLLPPPSEANLAGMNPSLTTVSPSSRLAPSLGNRQTTPVSSSVPNGTLYSHSGVSMGMLHVPAASKSPSASIGLPGSGPRMSQFSVPSAQTGGITLTQVRPGLIAHTTGSATPSPPLLLPTPPALPQVSISSSVPAQTQVQTKQVFAGAGMTVSPYADEELVDEQGSEDSNSEDGERIKAEPEDEDRDDAHFGPRKDQPQPVSMSGVAFTGYRQQNGEGGLNVLSSLAFSADSSAIGANGLSATSASVSASAGGWSSSLSRSEAREDSVSVSGSGSPRTRSRSRSMTRSRSNSAEFEHYSAGSGRGGFGKYEEDGMDMDYDAEGGVDDGLRVGRGIRKEREREREEEEGWVDMDMDM